MKRLVWIFALTFFLVGCAMQSIPLLGKSEKRRLTLDDLDTQIRQQLPMTLKGKSSKVVLGAVVVQEGDRSDHLSVTTRFVMKSFEIPEGIGGTLRYSATLLYDPESRSLYFDRLVPESLNFSGDASLQEYISASARSEIPVLIAQGLRSLVVYRFNSSFKAKKLKRMKIHQDTLILEFE
jgi:hypothetical protein